jgi:DNA-binding winged helix-turn-helix (wHTH) protein
MSSKLAYRFGPYLLDPFHRILLRSSIPVLDIDAQAFEVLLVLVRHSDEFVSAEQFREEAWKGVHVEQQALCYQIHILRKRILVGSPAEKIEIQTKYKLGYRLGIKAEPIGETEITDADRSYLEGRYHWQKATAQSVKRAIEFFNRATELDAHHALAYSALADSWVLAGRFGHQSESALLAMPKAETAARKALEIDEQLPEARAALAAVHALYWWDWNRAKEEFQKAADDSPNPMVRAWYALCSAGAGEPEQARREIEIAISRNPALPVLRALSGRIYYLDRNFQRAISECEKAIALERFLYLGPLFLGHTLRATGRFEEAKTTFMLARDLSDAHPTLLAELGHIHAVMGETQEAMGIIERLESLRRDQYVSPHMLSVVYLGLGDKERALSLLEQTLAERGAYMIFLTTDPVYDSLRKFSRFKDLVQRVGFA